MRNWLSLITCSPGVSRLGTRAGRLAAAATLLAALCCFFSPAAAQESPRELREMVIAYLGRGNYADAILPLQQLIDYLGESTDRDTVLMMEPVYFNLGLCHFLLGQFPTSEDAFRTYIKKYPNGPHVIDAAVFIADGYRFTGQTQRAMAEYKRVIKVYRLDEEWMTDVLCSMARCALAEDDWTAAIPILEQVYMTAPDNLRRNWAATLLATAYLKELKLDNVYRMVPYLIIPTSFASRSVAFNLAALEAGDFLFANEMYRDALWIYRLVYPREVIKRRSQEYLVDLQAEVEWVKRFPGLYRELLRAQEALAEAEAEIKALEEVPEYDIELFFRIGRASMEIRRYREAMLMFIYLNQTADGEKAEQALFLAFHCATRLDPWDDAFELGQRYMDEYPGGTYYDDVSLTVGQMYATRKDWPEVIRVLETALRISPQHRSAAECMFLLGYAFFMEEKFSDAVHWLSTLKMQFPENVRAEEGAYWLAMALLFDTRYETARNAFADFLRYWPESSYREDAMYRYAVCDYGLSNFNAAEEGLQRFVRNYPDSSLLGEAYMMLADIAAFFGEQDQAVTRFETALRYDLNIELFNYCYFRAGEILNDLKQYADLVTHFEKYRQVEREGLNIPQAVYWIVKGKWEQGQQREALAYFLAAIDLYGRERNALGIDLMLDQWIELSRQLEDETAQREAWDSLFALLQKARAEGAVTLELRLRRCLAYRPEVLPVEREGRLNELLREEYIPFASPTVLELIMDRSEARNDRYLAMRAAEEIVAAFPETEYALYAHMLIAEQEMAAGEYEKAEANLQTIITNFAANPLAGKALLMLGNLNLERGKYDVAEDNFKDVLGVREWRGELWPAALYGSGMVAIKQGNLAEACAFFERIYLLYSHYAEWTAKAYLQRAKCLGRMQQYGKAEETLREMLSNEDLKGFPETREAQEMLANSRSQGR